MSSFKRIARPSVKRFGSSSGAMISRIRAFRYNRKCPTRFASGNGDNCLNQYPASNFRCGPFPPMWRATLRYSESPITLTTGTGGNTGTAVTFNLNSGFAPKASGGHQPMDWDQITAVYDHYQVRGVRFLVHATSPGSTADMILFVHVRSDSSTANLNGIPPSRVLETPQCQCAHLSTSGNRSAIIDQKYWLNQILGMTIPQYQGNPNYSAAWNASPANLVQLDVNVMSASAAGGESCTCLVTLEFLIDFYQRDILPQS